MRKRIKFDISINETLCGIYMLAVWSIYLFVHHYNGKEDNLKFAGLFLLCAVAAFGVSKCVLTWIRRLPAAQNTEITRKRKICLYCIFFLISLGILCLWYAAYYPGAYMSDSINQYKQAVTGNYSDWHPVWHTLLFFSLPLALTGNLGSIVFFQIVYFALVLAYLGLTVYEFAGRKAAVLALAYILVNPYTGYIAVYPWKDVAMAVTLLWAMIYVARLYCTDGKWAVNNRGGAAMLAVLLANGTLFRHNAILFTLPLVLGLFFYLEQKKWLELILVFFVFLFLVKVPVYQALGVEKADKRRQEIMGVPLTVIGNVVKEHPEVLDEETANFAYRMASQEEWEEQYICGNFNTIKWGSIDMSVIEETGTVDILKMTVRCFRVAPLASCKALFTLTDIAYSIESAIEGAIIPWTADNEYGIDFYGNEKVKHLLTQYEKVITHVLLEHIGTSILLMLMFILGRSNLKKWRDWKRILLCLPIFLYNFGTMLLLTGDDSRFFYISFLVCPIIVLMMMKDEFTCEKQL